MRSILAPLAAVLALTTPAPTQSTTYPNVVYATVTVNGAPFNLLLDLMVPNGTGPWPLVVWVHGGAWIGGSRLPIPGAATRLLARGYAVASIDYRLSTQAIWPAQIHDCKAAIRFLRANASTWALDPHRIGVMGSSAGGHLVAALATMGGVGSVRIGAFEVDLEGAVGAHAGTSSRVQCAIDQFGPTDMLFANDLPTFDHDAPGAPESRLVGGPLQDNPEKWASVDPRTFLSPDDAPILAMHGTDDTTVPFHQSELLAASAVAIGHDTTLFPVPGNGHGGPGFLSAAATAAMDAFLDRTLRDLPAVTVGVTATVASASENGSAAAFQVARTGSTAAPLLVRIWLDGDVEVGADCAPIPLVCTIPAGQSTVAVPLSPLDDGLVEGTEAAVLHLAPAGTYRIDAAVSSARATIADDEPTAGLPLVTVQPSDAAATEAPGNPGSVRCVRAGDTTAPLVVDYEVIGTATNGVDFTALSGSVTIPTGFTTAPVDVVPLQDQQREPGETVIVRLLPTGRYVPGPFRSAHVVIADDDRLLPLPVVGVLGIDPTLAEPASHGAFRLTRTGATTQPLVVQFALTGTATNGSDFAAIGASMTIPAGAAWVPMPVNVLDDGLREGREDVVLTIAASGSYVVGAAHRRQLWILDDEAPAPAPGPVTMAVGQLEIGSIGVATLVGGAPGGFASLWLGLAPGYLPLPPYGTVLLDPAASAPFVTSLFDSSGAATLPITVPLVPALAGLPCWWQAIAGIALAPSATLTDAAERIVLGRGSL